MIVCPSCATSYMIDPTTFGPGGRTVRCARCRHSWHVGGPAAAPDDIQSFVDNVIAEADAQHGQPPAAHATADYQNEFQAHAPDDFGNEVGGHDGTNAHDHAAYHEPMAAPEPDRLAMMAGAAPMPEAPPIVPSEMPEPPPHVPRFTPGADVMHEDVESFAARREKLQVKRKKKRRASKWTALVLVLLGINIAVIGARSEIVRYFPQTASLFAAIGLPVNLRSMSFENVKVTREEADGVAILLVEGEIVSVASASVEVPRIRFAVRNSSGQEIYAWTALAPRSVLGAGERLPFRSRLASPPADAADVMVRFFSSRDAVSSAR